MVALTFEGASIEAAEGQTVLAALEAAGVPIDSSCRAGVCQSCLVQSLDGAPPKAAQAGLSRALAMDGYFMACVCVPEAPLAIGRAGRVRQTVPAVLREIEPLSPTVLRLRLEPQGAFAFQPGQFLLLADEASQVARSYSIAGAADGLIELHVRVIPGGQMSGLLCEARPGRRMSLSGPSGACVYDEIEADKRLVLAGTGTGLAPLWAILNDALAKGHKGPISLYHGALDASGLYLVEELKALQAARETFSYVPCIREEADPTTDLVNAVTRAETEFSDTVFFLCGDELLVRRLKRSLFLAGAKLDAIRADPFVAAQPKLAG